MGSTETSGKIPLLLCRGTHYEIGFQIGKSFKSMIQELLNNWKFFQDLLQIGSTPAGKTLIEDSLKLCKDRFPAYLDEIRGMGAGSEIPFEHLFMLNIDSILSTAATPECDMAEELEKCCGGTGCTSILCNKDEIILGHTEDAMKEIKDHVYIISAEVLSEDEQVLEKFTTFCYAGTLMGYTMGFNSYGMVYSVNTIFPHVCTSGSPRAFIARAVLGAKDLSSLVEILKDKGNGVADGFSLNVYFYPNWNNKDEPYIDKKSDEAMYNIEIAPVKMGDEKQSGIEIYEVHPGSSYAHCNRYLRLDCSEYNATAMKFSDMRNAAVLRHDKPTCEENIKLILSDQTDFNYPIYNDGKKEDEPYTMSFIRTVAVGIFNMKEKTWSVYSGPPASKAPDHVFTLI